MHKKPAEPAKRLPATNCTPVAFCTNILTSGVRKGKQCRLKASDETGKFCNYHKRQRIRYEFFLPKMYFYQELFQGFAWFLRLAFEGLFNSVVVFLTLSVFGYSSCLACLCITVAVHRYKWGHFVLLVTFWYFFWCVYWSPLICSVI